MIVDDSYTAWARPTRRVHFALSAGMTLTGVILIAVGAFGDRSAAPLSPALGRTAHNVVNGGDGTPGSVIPPAPLLPFLPRSDANPDGADPGLLDGFLVELAADRPACGSAVAGVAARRAEIGAVECDRLDFHQQVGRFWSGVRHILDDDAVR